MARCHFPRCTLNGEFVPRACSGNECEGVLHHSCFAAFCDRQGVEDPEGVGAFCWACTTKDWPAEAAREGSNEAVEGSSNDVTEDDDVVDVAQIELPSPSASSPHESFGEESPLLPPNQPQPVVGEGADIGSVWPEDDLDLFGEREDDPANDPANVEGVAHPPTRALESAFNNADGGAAPTVPADEDGDGGCDGGGVPADEGGCGDGGRVDDGGGADVGDGGIACDVEPGISAFLSHPLSSRVISADGRLGCVVSMDSSTVHVVYDGAWHGGDWAFKLERLPLPYTGTVDHCDRVEDQWQVRGMQPAPRQLPPRISHSPQSNNRCCQGQSDIYDRLHIAESRLIRWRVEIIWRISWLAARHDRYTCDVRVLSRG